MYPSSCNFIKFHRIFFYNRNFINLLTFNITRQHTHSSILNLHAQSYNAITKRFYRPDLHIDWVGIKRRWHTKQLINKKKKHKNHARVALRFRLTRFGWERLQSGRNAKKYNLTRLKYKNKMRIKFVSRPDLKKLKRQLPGYSLRIRDPPINNNPNIRKIRDVLNAYFG